MVLTIILTTVLSVTVTAMTTACIVMIKKSLKTFRCSRTSLCALLKDRLVQANRHFKAKGEIDMYSLDSLETMYHEYRDLDGNGYVTGLMTEIRALPKK